MANLILYALAFATVAEIILTIVLVQLLVHRRKIIFFYFIVLTIAAIFWNVSAVMMLFSDSKEVILAGYWIFLIAPMVSTLFILYFCQQFKDKKPNIIYVVPILGLILYALILAKSQMLINITLGHDYLNSIQPNRLYYVFYILFFIIYFNWSIYLLRAKTGDSQQRLQAQNLVYGTALTGGLGVVTNLVLPLFGVTQTVWIGQVLSLIFLSFFVIAISRYQLFDVRATILKSTSYLVSVFLIAVLYIVFVGGLLGLTVLRNAHISVAGWICLIVSNTIIAFTFSPIKKYFDKISTKLFYQDAYEPQELYDRLNRILVSTLDLDKLLHDSTTLFAESLKAEYCLVGLRKPDDEAAFRIVGAQKMAFSAHDIEQVRKVTPKYAQSVISRDDLSDEYKALRQLMIKNGISVLVRLSPGESSREEGLGYIVLGAKRSGNPYSRQDARVLDTIAKELIIAIQNAMHFEEIQNFAGTLQQRVDEATRKLQNANKRLTELDETKDDFISMASHQLRTPLTSVKGYLSLVLEGDAGKISTLQRKMLSQAFTSSQHMVYLIADLLNVSRLKTGKFVIDAVPSNLADVVKEEIDQLTEVLDNHSLKLVYNKPQNFPELMVDETKTRQVIMNFIDNAIYYTPAGGTVTVELLDKPSSVELRVVDNGIGVPKAEQHHLFTKFYRAGNARKARPDGTGLGLFMAKKVVIAQGGSIVFESHEGKGSVFGFSLPKATHSLPKPKVGAKSIPAIETGVQKVSR